MSEVVRRSTLLTSKSSKDLLPPYHTGSAPTWTHDPESACITCSVTPTSFAMDALIAAIQTTPIIDHHTHNILIPSEMASRPLLCITSEASEKALEYATSTLAHIRAVRQLAEVLRCEGTWEAVQARIEEERKRTDHSWARRCLEGLETLLIDDGLDENTVYPYRWHDCLTRSKCKKIVRIEKIAERIIESELNKHSRSKAWLTPDSFRVAVEEGFSKAIQEAISDPEVVGFKSIICYRTGLAIPAELSFSEDTIRDLLNRNALDDSFRLEDDDLGPYFVHLTVQIIGENGIPGEPPKPLQFHTGYGDNDLNLWLSNPCHLRDFIEMYPWLPIVLLHGSYPFTREAGYLASVYENVYLDLSLVFPCVSADGQEAVVRQALELCPTKKLLWSTDGHWFPETYLLAVLQVREVLEQILVEYVQKNILTPTQATTLVQDVFFKNANKLYNLGLTLPDSVGLPLQPKESGLDTTSTGDLTLLTRFLNTNPEVKYLRLQILDYTATPRARVLPVKQALKLVSEKRFVGITKAIFGLLQNDTLIPGYFPSGEYSLHPCFESLRLGERGGYATVQCEFREKDGSGVARCPRTALRKTVEKAKGQLGVEFLVGFELEVVFMSCTVRDGEVKYGEIPVTQGHAWSTARAMQGGDIMDVVEEIVETMSRSGIEVEQFHPESAPGQFEFITGPLSPLEAVDTLLAAKEIISAVASKHSLRATFYPNPFPNAAGTGAHVHISMSPSAKYESFYAGVLKNLFIIAAFTYANEASYERVKNGNWSGGTWIAWGTQNRETPLRKIEGSHWEIKCMDGLANPYLALATVLGFGIKGLIKEERLELRDCRVQPFKLTDAERKLLGITDRMPESFHQALTRLQADRKSLSGDILSSGVLQTYLDVKVGESGMLAAMDPDARRKWLIERY